MIAKLPMEVRPHENSAPVFEKLQEMMGLSFILSRETQFPQLFSKLSAVKS